MDNEIIRRPTEKDNQYIDVNLQPRRKKTSHEMFQIELIKHEQEAVKKGLPFARHAAREDFKKAIDVQIAEQVRKYGSVEHPEDLKVPEMDWAQYSDPKNFTIVNKKLRADDNLSNKNPGLNVEAETIRYQYKDYENNRYIVMENAADSIRRAVVARAKLDKEVASELNADKPQK